MIIKTNEELKIEGNIPDLLTDLTMVVKEIKEIMVDQAGLPEKEVREMVERSIALAFKSFDEIKKEAMEIFMNNLKENPEEAIEGLKKAFLDREDGAKNE